MAALGVAEVGAADEAARLGRVVVRDRGLEPLAKRARLAELAAKPAQQAHGGGVGRHRSREYGL